MCGIDWLVRSVWIIGFLLGLLSVGLVGWWVLCTAWFSFQRFGEIRVWVARAGRARRALQTPQGRAAQLLKNNQALSQGRSARAAMETRSSLRFVAFTSVRPRSVDHCCAVSCGLLAFCCVGVFARVAWLSEFVEYDLSVCIFSPAALIEWQKYTHKQAAQRLTCMHTKRVAAPRYMS